MTIQVPLQWPFKCSSLVVNCGSIIKVCEMGFWMGFWLLPRLQRPPRGPPWPLWPLPRPQSLSPFLFHFRPLVLFSCFLSFRLVPSIFGCLASRFVSLFARFVLLLSSCFLFVFAFVSSYWHLQGDVILKFVFRDCFRRKRS